MASLTFILLCPLLAALLIAVTPRSFRVLFRLLAVGATLLSAVGALRIFLGFEAGAPGFQFVERAAWISSLGASYHLGVDGLNVGLVLMAALVAFAAACVSWEIEHREKEFYLLLMVMTGGVLGTFAALDLLLFYVFHELALIPTFLMIGIWGRGPEREYATFKVTLYLTAGAMLVLLGLVGIYAAGDFRTLDLVELQQRAAAHPIPPGWQGALFGLLMFGFGVLVSLWPFHTWAPMAYASAPTPTAMLHAGVLKKVGLYGLIRIALPLLPEGARDWLPWLALLCMGNIIYAGLVAMRQRDLNLLAGNSSVAHVGFAFLGIASLTVLGVTGAVVVMVAHGLLAALMFGLNGFLYQRLGTLEMDRLGGLLTAMPFAGTVLIAAMLAGCGLPGFAGFPGEALVLFGAWEYSRWLTALAAWGALVLAAVYMLRAIRAVLHGPLSDPLKQIKDVSGVWRKLPYVILLAALIIFGIWPRSLTDKATPVVKSILAETELRVTSPVASVSGKASARANNRQVE